jgi:molybdopterin converting factor small subunit
LISVVVLPLERTIRELLGKDEMVIKLSKSKATVAGLITMLDKKCGGKIGEAILKSKASILINGQDFEFLGGMNTRLANGDRVIIIPLVAGG